MVKGNFAQMKIMQMAFMIVAVIFLFVLVGLFFLNIKIRDIFSSASDLQREQAISSLEVIADMPELNYGSSESMTIDKDKLRVMMGDFAKSYDSFWTVASVKVYLVYPSFDEIKKCPAIGCNYYEIYDNGQSNIKEYATYVSVCEQVKEGGSDYDSCEIGKLVVGVNIYEED